MATWKDGHMDYADGPCAEGCEDGPERMNGCV